MAQTDKAEKKIGVGSKGWSRNRMNKTHRKGGKKAKEVSNSARRGYGKAVVHGALKSEAPPPLDKGIQKPDYKRCQAEKPNGYNFMTLGGRPGRERCTSKPTVMVWEMKKGKDGKRGQMTLCEDCLAVFKSVNPKWRTQFRILDIQCIDSPDGFHDADPQTITSQQTEMVVDVNCKHCGTSGSVTIMPGDILW